MPQNIDIKLVLSIAASVVTVIAYYPYIKDIFLRKTKPHIYTWLIWFITTGTATAGLWLGGGGNGIISISVVLLLVLFIVILSVKYGTKDITKGDTVILILALSSIIVWWQLDNPVLAVIMVAAIDGLGYIPTYRKSWNSPCEETFSFWVAMVAIYTLMLLSIAEYNLLTVPYVATALICNIILINILFFRRRLVTQL